jgi:Fe-S cluster assembly scaffold protein SufB
MATPDTTKQRPAEERALAGINADYKEKFGFHDPESGYAYKAPKGLSREVVESISEYKDEPAWMREFRLKALEHFLERPTPQWGGNLNQIDWDDIHYFVRASEKNSQNWDEVPEDIKNTFDRLGIPEAERKFLAGVGAQYESEVVYHQVREDLEKQGVIFLDMDSGLREHEEIVREHWATVIPPNDNKLAALNSAVWSGGSFVYVPKGVKVEMPLQAYFRINTENMGQFERTLILAEEGSDVHYIEGCTAPVYSTDSLHSAVVEIIAKPGARVRYTTVQNWSQNVYNLVTKRAVAHEDATMEWVDCNLGCLTGDSMIYTPDRGPVPIREIQAGDRVFGTDLQAMGPVARKVTATRDNGVQPVYRVMTENFRQLDATSNHPFLVLDRKAHGKSFQVRWRRLENIKVGDYVAVSKGMPDAGQARFLGDYAYEAPSSRSNPRPIDLPLETGEDLMWLLGVFTGDGGVERVDGRARRVSFAVPPEDHARPRLERTLRDVFGIEGVDKGPATLAVSSSILGDFILWLGFGGNAREKRIPGWVYTLPASQKLAFIEGYLDSDGHERKRRVVGGVQYGQITWASVNRDLLEDLKLLLIDCGLEPRKISTHESSRKLPLGTEEKTYRTHYLAINIRENLEAIRSHKAPKPVVEFVKVASIEELDEQRTYDIEVEGIENFTANGIVVHNSKLTMKYPSIYLLGERAHGEILSIAFAGQGQHQDAGGKIIHAAPRTTSSIFSKSISKDEGRTSYRGLLEIAKGATESKSKVVCDALLLDEHSRSDTYPTIRIGEDDVDVGHEASVSKIGEEQIFYLQSHGLDEEEASKMIVNGFIEPITKELPMEYAVEMNRLIELQMEGSIG